MTYFVSNWDIKPKTQSTSEHSVQTRAVQPVATRRQSPCLPKPAVVIMTSFSLWHHWRHAHRYGHTNVRTYGHLTALNI